jgi:hypothetical protein
MKFVVNFIYFNFAKNSFFAKTHIYRDLAKKHKKLTKIRKNINVPGIISVSKPHIRVQRPKKHKE